MNITESRLFMSEELKTEIHIEDGISAMIYDEDNVLEKVTFGK
jgi:hypothetical protein